MAKQVSRYRSGGYEALARRSTAPHGRPTQIPGELENEIVTLRKHLDEEGLDAGPLTIQYHLRQRHGMAPGRSTIHRALVRRGFVTPQPQKRPRSSWQRFEAALPNETWQADMTHWSIDDGAEEGMKVETLDFVDDYSRMVVILVTGDADFIPAVEWLQGNGNARIINAGWAGHGYDLKKKCWASFEIEHVAPSICR